MKSTDTRLKDYLKSLDAARQPKQVRRPSKTGSESTRRAPRKSNSESQRRNPRRFRKKPVEKKKKKPSQSDEKGTPEAPERRRARTSLFSHSRT